MSEPTQTHRSMRVDAQRNYVSLLKTVRVAVAERGADIVLEDIARSAGVAIGTLYRHFPTRQDLLEAVFLDETNALRARAEELASAPVPFDALMSWLRLQMDFAARGRSMGAAVMAAKHVPGTRIFAANKAMHEAGEVLLLRAQAEQELLIKELRLVQEHLERLDTEITDIVRTSREGQILLSMPPTGPVQAATIIATIGHIDNFEKASELKSYFGWAPTRQQTGVTFDRTKLSHRGVRPVKQMLFLMAARATTLDGEWARIYRRLLPRLATYDERVKEYRGKKKVLGRIAGQMVSMIFALLKTDQETLSRVPSGEEPPPPMFYDPEIHRKHQEGSYRPLKPGTQPRKNASPPKQVVVPLSKGASSFASFDRREKG